VEHGPADRAQSPTDDGRGPRGSSHPSGQACAQARAEPGACLRARPGNPGAERAAEDLAFLDELVAGVAEPSQRVTGVPFACRGSGVACGVGDLRCGLLQTCGYARRGRSPSHFALLDEVSLGVLQPRFGVPVELLTGRSPGLASRIDYGLLPLGDACGHARSSLHAGGAGGGRGGPAHARLLLGEGLLSCLDVAQTEPSSRVLAGLLGVVAHPRLVGPGGDLDEPGRDPETAPCG